MRIINLRSSLLGDFRVDTLKELFEIADSRNTVAFIKDINFYYHILILY